MAQVHNIVLSASHTQTKGTNTMLRKITVLVTIMLILVVVVASVGLGRPPMNKNSLAFSVTIMLNTNTNKNISKDTIDKYDMLIERRKDRGEMYIIYIS